MKPVKFPGHNVVLGPPAGAVGVQPLPVRRVEGPEGYVVSCWELDAGDLETIQRTGRVYLFVQGRTHPPLHLSASMPED